MSVYQGRGLLGVVNAEAEIPIPQDGKEYDLIVRITGTFVGTMQLQGDGSAKTTTTRKLGSGAAAANPTAVGTYAAQLGASEKTASVKMTAYTSGEANVELTLIPSER